MIFAAIVDSGILPCLGFTAMMAQNQYYQNSDTDGHWTSLFGTEVQTYKLLWATYLISVSDGGIHLVSLCLSIYLALIFRKISKLPPDMNPLEDNLTSRHKRNKSSLSTAPTEATTRDSHLSTPLMDAPRIVPFVHTRNESSTSLSSPQRRSVTSNRNSRNELGASYCQQPNSPRSSRADLLDSSERLPPKHSSMYSQVSQPQSRLSTMRPKSGYEPVPDENWVTHPTPPPSPPNQVSPPELQHLRIQKNQTPSPLPAGYKYDFSTRTPRPLEMNPPTPPVAPGYRQPGYLQPADRKPLQPAAGNGSPATWEEINFNDSGSAQNGGNGGYGVVASKARYYGNLHGNMQAQGRGQTRVISSGVEAEKWGGMRAREVSGKVAEEGRGGRYGLV